MLFIGIVFCIYCIHLFKSRRSRWSGRINHTCTQLKCRRPDSAVSYGGRLRCRAVMLQRCTLASRELDWRGALVTAGVMSGIKLQSASAARNTRKQMFALAFLFVHLNNKLLLGNGAGGKPRTQRTKRAKNVGAIWPWMTEDQGRWKGRGTRWQCETGSKARAAERCNAKRTRRDKRTRTVEELESESNRNQTTYLYGSW